MPETPLVARFIFESWSNDPKLALAERMNALAEPLEPFRSL